MRLLFVNPAAELGGAERCLLDSIAALRTANVDVEITLLTLASGPLVEQARALGATTLVLEAPALLAELGESSVELGAARALSRFVSAAPEAALFLRELERAIAQRRPDVVHTNGMKAHLLAGAVSPRRSRLVVHLHDFIGARRASRSLLPLLARVRRRAVFVANSRAVAADFAALAPRADVRTIYNVVDTEYFRPAAGEPDWLAQAAGLAPAPAATSFGLVATYARWKGHALFIDAAAELRAAHPDVPLRFYVVGGPIYKTLGSQVAASELSEHGRRVGLAESFGLVPFQEDIARVYRALDVVVHASTQPEPFGRTIVEAMACARPVIVARAGGAAELFRDGEHALGYAPGDARALAATMARMLDPTLRARLGNSARSHAVEEFGRSRLAAQLLGAYRA